MFSMPKNGLRRGMRGLKWTKISLYSYMEYKNGFFVCREVRNMFSIINRIGKVGYHFILNLDCNAKHILGLSS